MSAVLLPAASSPALLPRGAGLRRQVVHPGRPRPAAFMAAFEERALAYDCFWHHRGSRILIVGPAPLNLWPAIGQARYAAQPSGAALRARHYRSISVMITELEGAPPDTTSVAVELAGAQMAMTVQPSVVAALAGARVLFSMNKDNDLRWIAEWARYHAVIHGTDAVVLFDNGSTRYAPAELAATLAAVPNLAAVAVPSWPLAFGARDPAVKVDPFWSHFLQNASMSVVLRRYGRLATGLINCDVDELAAPADPSLYDLAERSRAGLVTFAGTWIEAAPLAPAGEPPSHRHYTRRLVDAERRQSRAAKWVIDPKREWFDRLDVHPYWHWIAKRPLFSKSRRAGSGYWHFRGINTNWKTQRTIPAAIEATEPDPALVAAFARMPE